MVKNQLTGKRQKMREISCMCVLCSVSLIALCVRVFQPILAPIFTFIYTLANNKKTFSRTHTTAENEKIEEVENVDMGKCNGIDREREMKRGGKEPKRNE